jgi:hypothetical protein
MALQQMARIKVTKNYSTKNHFHYQQHQQLLLQHI